MGAFVIANVTTTQRRIFYAGIPMNVFDNKNALMVQRRRYCTIIPMNAFAIANVTTTQLGIFYASIPMNVIGIVNVVTTQLGTSCSFDSPGLARNEPTPSEYSQGDSTPSVLSFFWESMVITRKSMADYA